MAKCEKCNKTVKVIHLIETTNGDSYLCDECVPPRWKSRTNSKEVINNKSNKDYWSVTNQQ